MREEEKHHHIHIAGLLSDCSHWCLPGVPDIWNKILSSVVLKVLLSQSCINYVTLTTLRLSW